MIDEVLAMDKVPAAMLRGESLMRLLIVCVPVESVTLNPAPMQASSLGPGKVLVLQLAEFCHRLLPPPPVHVTLHVTMMLTVAVADNSEKATLVALIVTVTDVEFMNAAV